MVVFLEAHVLSETHRREDFLFELPQDRIAQKPADKRDKSKLLVSQKQGEIQHCVFSELPGFLKTGDVLVLNQTRVMNARCYAQKENGVQIEVFILSIQCDANDVPVLLRPAKRVKPGMSLTFPRSGVVVEVISKADQGRGALKFESDQALHRVLECDGELPLPPYIKRESGPGDADKERYQTIFAKELGAVAAPTAGLHFSQDVFAKLETAGVTIAHITHHVGIGTFKPLLVDDVRDHVMDVENYTINPETALLLNRAKAEGRRIIAVGTTTTRCLESNYDGGFHAGNNQTQLYIYPGYTFKAINGLITNFHLPGSTLILLVAALVGRERILDIYRCAIKSDYRFYSYGDAMLLIP